MLRLTLLVGLSFGFCACGGAYKAPARPTLYSSNPDGSESESADVKNGNSGKPKPSDKPNGSGEVIPSKPSDPIPQDPIKPDPVKPTPDPLKPTPDPVKPTPEDCSQIVDQCPVPGGITWQCKKRFMHGLNYAWHNFSGDFGGIPSYGQGGVAASAAQVDKELLEMKTYGASVIRWWIMPDFRGAGVSFDSSNTPTGLGSTFEADLLKALELAEKHDLYLMLTMFSFDAFKPTRNDNGLLIRSLKPIIIDPQKRTALLEKVIRPMVKIGEKSPFKKRLMTWELINEPEWAMTGASKYGDPQYECNSQMYDCVTHQEMESFLADIAKVVRSESKALTSVGGAAIKWKNAWTRLDLDYHQYHLYDWVNTYFPYSKSPKDWELTDKPVVMGEFPFDGVTGANATKLLESWYGNGFGGALGWAVTDPVFNWSSNRAAIKAFVEKHSCQTQY